MVGVLIGVPPDPLENITIDTHTLSVPDLVRMARDKIKPLQMHMGFLNVPDPNRNVDLVRQLFGDQKLEQAVHGSERMN